MSDPVSVARESVAGPQGDAAAGARRVGIVDLGSNTARLVVYTYEAGRWFRLSDSIREPTRLAGGMGAERRLQPDAVERAMGALKMFADYAEATGLEDLEVLATSGLREAANRAEVEERIRSLGLEVKVLEGEEEAQLGVLAVANGFAYDDAWVLDLGGGSLQLSRMSNRGFAAGAAFPLGAVRLTEAHLENDPPKSSQIAALEEQVEKSLAEPLAEVAKDGLPLVAVGGTVRNLARIVQRRSGYPLPLLHAYFFRREDLDKLTAELVRRPRRRRRRMPGLSPDRADVIVAGALVLRWLLAKSGREGYWISGHGLREGAFYRHFLPPPHLLEDLRSFSIQNRFEQFAQPRLHTARVRFLARRLFDGLQELHGLDGESAALLDCGAVLHDIGTTIGYYRHHRHGELLVNSAALHGFSHREQALISLLVRYHRRNIPELGGFRHLVGEGDDRRLRVLALCLRLAEDLERSRSGRVEDVRVEVKRRRVRLVLRSRDQPSIEMSESLKHAQFFEKVLGRRLVIEAEEA